MPFRVYGGGKRAWEIDRMSEENWRLMSGGRKLRKLDVPKPFFRIGRFRSLPRLLNLPLTGPIELYQEPMSKPCK